MANLLLRNFKKPADYQKAVMNQDQLLRLAIQNDANTANARKMVKLGTPAPINEEQLKTPEELQLDTAKQQVDMISNLQELGFRYAEAGQIVALILASDGNDGVFKFNSVFPAIKKDVSSRFNIKLITPTFFAEYLSQYLTELDASKGMASSTGMAFITDKFNTLIDSNDELKMLIPTKEQIGRIISSANRLRANAQQEQFLQPIMNRLKELQTRLPDDTFWANMEQMATENPVRGFQAIQDLQTALADLPTKADFDILQAQIDGSEGVMEKIMDLDRAVASISIEQEDQLENIKMSIEAITPGGKAGVVLGAIGKFDFEAPSPLGEIGILGNKLYGFPGGDRSKPVEITGSVMKQLKERGNAQQREFIRRNPTIKSIREWVMEQSGGGSSARAVSELSGLTSVDTSSTTPYGGAKKSGDKSGVGIGGNSGIRLKKIGKGIELKQEPTYSQFGKYAIHMGQLKNQDIFNVKYKSLGGIPHFKPTPVSDVFKDFVIDLMETGKANQRIYDQIPLDERKMFEAVASGAGIIDTLKIKRTTTNQDKEDLARFELLKGEYLAGNNSVAVMKELRRFVIKFMAERKITKNDGMNLLLELSI